MGVPSITTNLSGFGSFMQDLIEEPGDEGCYIVDRRLQSIEDAVNQLTEYMFSFASKTRRQRINQRNRVERLSPLLDWKNLGVEYSKSRQLALRRAYPDQFEDEEEDEEWYGVERVPFSVPGSPRFRGGAMTPGDMGTLTEEVRTLFRFHIRPISERYRLDLNGILMPTNVCSSFALTDAGFEYERLSWTNVAEEGR